MIKHYGNYTLNEIYSFFVDCIGVKFTEESDYKNKKKLGINGDSEELFFGKKGIIKKFFSNFNEPKIEEIISVGLFKNYSEYSKDALFNIFPDSNDMTPYYMGFLYLVMGEVKNEFEYQILDDTYKDILTNSGFKYEETRKWKEEGNKKTFDLFRKMYNQIDEPNLKERFLIHSFILNIKEASAKLFNLNELEKEKMWEDIKYNKGFQFQSFNEIQDMSSELLEKTQKLLLLIDSNVALNKNDESKVAINSFGKLYPKSSSFFCNWFLGHLLLVESKNEFLYKDQILDYYKNAFDYINYAGASIKLFLEMSLAISMRLESKSSADIAKVAANEIDGKKITNNGVSSVLSPFAKKVYNYSLLLGFNDIIDKNQFPLVFFKDENFFLFFPNKRNSFQNIDGDNLASKDYVDKKIEQFKNSNLRTVKELVKLTEVSYPPIVGLITYGEYYSAFELLNKFWFKKGKNGYKVIEQPATNNTTPLIQLLTNYKSINEEFKTDCKRMIMKLINGYSKKALKLRTNRSTMREPIQEAIHTCDKEIVVAILDKCKMNVDTYKIGLDDESILEYTLGLQVSVPRFNNGLPHNGEESIKLDRILPIGTTKSSREANGKAALERSKIIYNELRENMSVDNLNEFQSIIQIGRSTRQAYLEMTDILIKRSTHNKFSAKIDMFHRDTDTINANIEKNKA
jgi:hypothetical protein